jgi:hypothetical protein
MMWLKIALIWVLALVFSCSALHSQELPDTESQAVDPLEKSLTLLNDTISLVETIQNDNENLKVTLQNVSDMLKAQGQLLNEQAQTQAEQSKISARQSLLLGRELRKGKVLKVSLIISVPVCIGLGIWAGWQLNK